MSNYNRAILVGRLTNDPELQYTPSGKAVAKFMLAINSSHKNKAGDKVDNADFIPITVWDKQAETVAEWLSKGKPVLVEGRIKQEKWVSKDGQNRSRLLVIANAVRFLGSKDDNKSTKKVAPQDDAPAQDESQEDNAPAQDVSPADDAIVQSDSSEDITPHPAAPTRKFAPAQDSCPDGIPIPEGMTVVTNEPVKSKDVPF